MKLKYAKHFLPYHGNHHFATAVLNMMCLTHGSNYVSMWSSGVCFSIALQQNSQVTLPKTVHMNIMF